MLSDLRLKYILIDRNNKIQNNSAAIYLSVFHYYFASWKIESVKITDKGS